MKKVLNRLWTFLFLALLFPVCGLSQSADALIEMMLKKGLLTQAEAEELRREADEGFRTSYRVQSGSPPWLKSLHIGGDLRVRYEGFYSDAVGFMPGVGDIRFTDRHRFRYRVRLDTVATLHERFEIGLRLGSGEPVGNFGGDPISGNTTMRYNASQKFVYIDLAYATWRPLAEQPVEAALTVGKMTSPFVLSELVLDRDYTPEGLGLRGTWQLDPKHAFKLNSGAFILHEIDVDSHDPYLLGAQLRLDSEWKRQFTTSLGGAFLTILNPHTLTNSLIPNINRGNTRTGLGTPAYGFDAWILDAAVTYHLDGAPLYSGRFPISIGADYIRNTAAPSHADNTGYSIYCRLGRAGRRQTWEVSYTWRRLGANAWFEELVDSDFGAFYGRANSPPNSERGMGYGSGTNVRGSIVEAAYSPYDSLTLSARWYLTELIRAFPADSDSEMNRLQVDALWRF